MLGFVAENILSHKANFIEWDEVDALLVNKDKKDDFIVLDVTEEMERMVFAIDGSYHIPLGSLRQRLNELDKNKLIIPYCAVGVRSYNAARILMQNGFDRVAIDPRNAEAYGCYVEVIVDCAQNYLSDVSSLMQVTNVSGSELSDLYAYIQQDIPVIVWTTIDLVEPVYTTEWVINGETLKWLSNEHCVVLTGYNQDENVVYAADPLKGNVTYDASLFEQRYNQLFSQAVIIN